MSFFSSAKILEREGYLVVRGALSTERVTALKHELGALEQRLQTRECKDTELYKSSATRVMIHDIDSYD